MLLRKKSVLLVMHDTMQCVVLQLDLNLLETKIQNPFPADMLHIQSENNSEYMHLKTSYESYKEVEIHFSV